MRQKLAAAAILIAGGVGGASAQEMSFFITSQNPGNGGNFAGLEGADAHCQALADTAGAGSRTWHAYLSTSTVDARDRIGTGPWVNAAGVEIAPDVATLHSDGNNLTKETALDETGAVVNGRGDEPNRHDILTGSLADGTKAPETCGDWTDGGENTAGVVGHHDRMGPEDSPTGTSWNAAHASRGGCGLEALRGTGGDGLLYCFAID